jgi:DNA-binding transcriptional ArsR family regulator
VTVYPDEVRRFGASAAIVLAALRDQGCSPTIPVLVTYAAIGRLCGLHKRSVRRALDRLRGAGGVKVEPYRLAGKLMVRTVDSGCEGHTADPAGQEEVTRRARDGLARLDTLRSLLEAVG